MKRFFLFAITLVLVAGCNVTSPFEDVHLILDVEDTEVDLGQGVQVNVVPGETHARTESVSNDLDVASVEDLKRIQLKPSFFTFRNGVAGKSSSSATGTLEVNVFVAGFPLPGTPISVTIQNNVVTVVNPSSISFVGTTYTLDEAGVNDFLNSLPADERPDLEAWQSATLEEVRDALNQALSGTGFPVTIGTSVVNSDPNDPLTGSLRLNQISLDARVQK